MELPKRIFHGAEVHRLYRDLLEADVSSSGGSAELTYATPTGLIVGGGNSQGSSDDVPRADHRHALPAFGTTAGTFCEGNDSRFSVPRWVPDAPKTAPHACADWFQASSLDAKWTVLDPGTVFTKAVDTTRRMYALSATSPGPANASVLAGVGQATPASEFSVAAKVANIFHSAGGGAETCAFEVGLFVSEDIGANPTTADIYTFGSYQFDNNGGSGNAQGMRARGPWSAYNVGGGGLDSVVTSVRPYVRVRMNGAVCRAETSPDGVSWYRLWNGTLAFTPSYFGVYAAFTHGGTWTTGSPAVGLIDFVDVASGAGSSAVDALQLGRFI